MPSTYTTLLRLEKPANGEQNLTWGDTVDRNYDLIEQAITGVATINVTGQTLITLTVGTGTSDQARMAVVVITGTLSANCRIVWPAVYKTVNVYNYATGSAFNVVLAQSPTAGGLVLPFGTGGRFFMDGLQVYTSSVVVTALTTTAHATIALTLSVAQSATIGQSTVPVVPGTCYGYASAGPQGQIAVGSVNYSIYATGRVIAPQFLALSDARVKTDLSALTPAQGRAWVVLAKPMHYVMDGKPSAGFIAQDQARAGYHDLVLAMPDEAMAERTDPDGFTSPAGVRLNLDYLQTIAYLTAHCQSLEARLSRLEAVSPV